MDETRITTRRLGAILVVTIDRPGARNAFDSETSRQMEAAMDRLEAEPDLRLGVVTGANGVFSAGADLKGVAAGEAWSGERGGFGVFARPPAKPLIAAVEGYAVGGGFELCLSCDLIVAARDARFGLPEVRVGVLAIGGGLFRLPRRLPYHLAMEFALTGELRQADFLHGHGVVNRLTEPGGALDGAIALAEQVLRNAPLALAASKQIMARAHDWTDAEAWTAQMPIANVALHSEDAREGVAAFNQKRPPVWKGR